jgi:hypothetical protein
MTELETQEDGWARGVFDRVRTGHDEPPWTPDPATASRLSTRRRTRMRVTGALTTAAVVGLSATAFATLGGGTAGRGQQAVSEHQYRPPQDARPVTPASSLSKYLLVGIANAGSADVPPEVAATIGTVLTGIDPSLSHVRSNTYEVDPLRIGPQPAGTVNAVQAAGFWTTDGDVSPLRESAGHDPSSKPVGTVMITVWSPFGARQAMDRPSVACGLEHAVYLPGNVVPTAWSPCTEQKQSDGSVIIAAHSLGASAGEVDVAARRFPNGSMVVAAVTSFFAYDPGHENAPLVPGAAKELHAVSGPALRPVPWTDDTLGDALSGPDVKGLP